MTSSRIIRSILTGVAAGIILAAVFAAGFLTSELLVPAQVIATEKNEELDFALLTEVQSILNRIYLHEQPDYTTRQYGAIRGLLQSLADPNTYFIEPPVARSEADALAGTYGGIGVLVRRDEQGRFLLTPYPDSPAERAGIEDGDVLLAIDNESVDTNSQQDVIDQALRGEVKDGNGVTITVGKANSDQLTTFIEFDVINVPSVIWRVIPEDDRIGYVQILSFTNRTPAELRDAVNKLKDTGISSLILDLRNNTGGLLDEAIAVADEFIDGGVLMIEEDAQDVITHEASDGGVAIDLPLVVLVNNRTASASEIVAGAIRDRNRGILIGQQTFGKGTVQQIFSLSDGSSIHVTSAQWFTPARVPIDGAGITPDIAMIPDESGRDVELGEAIRKLQEEFETDT